MKIVMNCLKKNHEYQKYIILYLFIEDLKIKTEVDKIEPLR